MPPREENIICIETPFGGFFIDRESDKKMAAVLVRGEHPSKDLLAIASKFVDSDSTVIDIGAHIGTFTIPMSKIARKVTAFEPAQGAFVLLSRNTEKNNIPSQLINKALGSEKGSGTLVTRNASNTGANTLVAGGDIPVSRLDDEVTHADFIKIDVEGMELEVLNGGKHLIQESRPVVLFEVNLSQLRAHGTSPHALAEFFKQFEYELYFPVGGKELHLASIANVTLLTALIAPRAWLFWQDSAPFDLLAVPKGYLSPLPITGFMSAIKNIIRNNLAIKRRRIKAFLRRSHTL